MVARRHNAVRSGLRALPTIGRMTDHAQAERAALADLLDAEGPEAPTLCRGWTTADLAAHLVIRESDPLNATGIMFGPLAGRTRAAMSGLVTRLGYREVVDRFRKGPPRWSPARLGAVDQAINTAEFFVHHEDVRRARPTWERREIPADLERFLWGRVSRGGRFLLRRVAVGVLVARPDGTTVRVRGGEPTAVLTGEPSELALFMFGRKDAAQVHLSGPDEAVEALAVAPLGV